jgi:hypothetical protein
MATGIRNCLLVRGAPQGHHHTLRARSLKPRSPFDDSRRSFHFYDDGKVTFLMPIALLAKLASLLCRPRNLETGQSLGIVISSSTEPYDKIQNQFLLKLQ